MEAYLKELDTQLFFFVNHQMANVVFDWLCPILRNKITWIPLYAAAAVFLVVKHKAKALWVIIAAVATVGLTDQIAANFFKSFFERLRPCNEPLIKEQVRLLVKCGIGFSFISAHAANHFGLAAFFSFLYRKKWLTMVLMIWAAAIAFSQVYVGVHYPADVLFGALLGIALGYASNFCLKKCSVTVT